jgi:hypothetical protein
MATVIGIDGLPIGTPGGPVAAIDPTAAELIAITNLAEAKTWAGIDEALQALLSTAFGGEFSLIREVVLVPRSIWDSALSASGLSVLQLARASSLRRVCRLRANLAPGELPAVFMQPSSGSAAVAGVVPAGVSVSSGDGAERKLSDLVDQTLHCKLIYLDRMVFLQALKDYKTKFGQQPMESAEPTHEQLSAVHQILGFPSVAYVDFGLFGKHGRRLLAQLAFFAFVLMPDGMWTRRQLHGPENYNAWWGCWRVYSTALVLLKACDREVLDAYAEFIRALNEDYGERCWYLVLQGDVRMRSERFERLRCNLEIEKSTNPLVEFDELRPWNTVYSRAVVDHDFWDKEVRRHALLVLAKIETPAEAMEDDTVQPSLSNGDGGGLMQSPKRQRTRARGNSQAHSPASDNNRKGNRICPDYTAGACSAGRACPMAHQCNICWDSHSGSQHEARAKAPPKPALPAPPAPPAKGSGKSKKKGKPKAK